MRVGLLGGSFNPVHNGHIALARTALNKLELDEIWFLPVGNHPLKRGEKLLPVEHRIELLKKALKHKPAMKISTQDSGNDEFNFTDVLLKKLYQDYPETDFFFLAGMDILEELPRWHDYRWLLQNVRFVIFTRPGTGIDHIKDFGDLPNFVFIEMKPLPISSREIRRLIAKGKSVTGLVPESIEQLLIEFYSEINEDQSSSQ